MASLLDIRRRIHSIANTRQITRAMKMVAAARLRRAQVRALAARPYEKRLTSVLTSLVERAEIYDPATGEARHPLLEDRAEENILLVVISADRGLAGAFNANIVKAAIRFTEQKAQGQAKRIEIEAIGRKGHEALRRRFPVAEPNSHDPGTYVSREPAGATGKADISRANELCEGIIDRYTKQEIDSVYLVFNEFKSVLSQRVLVTKILPIQEIGKDDIQQRDEPTEEERRRVVKASRNTGVSLRPAGDHAGQESGGLSNVDYIYEQPPNEIFSGLLPKYVGMQVFRALLESTASEHAARMTAMDSATNNANDMNDKLTLEMNRARQAKITTEIIEIVAGASAE